QQTNETVTTETKSEGKEIMNFNIIDTPGFYDLVSANDMRIQISNEKIIQYINECMLKDITHIHLFAFVFTPASTSGGINQHDIDSMKFVKETFPELSKSMALIITHCEQIPETNREQLVEDFFNYKELPVGLYDFFGLKHKFMGCIRPETVRERNEQAARIELKNVLKMREEFIKFIIDLEGYCNIHDLLPDTVIIPRPCVNHRTLSSADNTSPANSVNVLESRKFNTARDYFKQTLELTKHSTSSPGSNTTTETNDIKSKQVIADNSTLFTNMCSVKHYSRQQVKQELQLTPGSDNTSGESDDECFFPMPTAAFDQPDMLPEMNLKDYFPDGNDNVQDI
ncbi:unnamed protein product, partial [Didymodactylos carnosus]